MSLWSYGGVKASKQPTKIGCTFLIDRCHVLTLQHAIDDDACIDQLPKFFDGARMNYAENLLCGKDDAVALIEINEKIQKSPRKYTWKELKELVARYAGVLKREGASQGDVIVRKCFFWSLSRSFLKAQSHRRQQHQITRFSTCCSFDWCNVRVICDRYWREGTFRSRKLRFTA
jgi:hypothetical protein